jgi:CRISPR/Cas system-associated endoribonuclease Cas2
MVPEILDERWIRIEKLGYKYMRELRKNGCISDSEKMNSIKLEIKRFCSDSLLTKQWMQYSRYLLTVTNQEFNAIIKARLPILKVHRKIVRAERKETRQAWRLLVEDEQ